LDANINNGNNNESTTITQEERHRNPSENLGEGDHSQQRIGE